jgi:tetratricopeptide (TPR) repeat protein
VSSHAARADPRAFARRLTLPAAAVDALTTLAIAAVLCAVALEGNGGLQLGPLTRVEVGIDLVAGALCAAAVVAGGHTRRPWGGVTLALMGALVVLTALSIGWAVEPNDAWIEANRTLSYLAVLGAGVALARLSPGRWPSLLGGVIVACVVICGYALVTKVFPGALSAAEVYARLRKPYGYWNAVGLTGALAGPACLWLGARRSGHAALNALAYPALGLLLVTLLLAYSRGSLLALGVGCAVWFAIVPLRLRAVAVLGTSAVGAGLVALWAFGSDALSKDRVPLHQRAVAGHELGLVLVAMALLLLVAGLAIGFALARRAPSHATRRRVGAGLLVALGLVPVVLLAGLALSSHGLGGSISKGWKDLTDPNASVAVSNAPDRLTAVGSVRAQYWKEALQIFRAHEAVGVGAGGYATARLRHRRDAVLQVRHAHGYAVQTLADLGLVGAAVSLALLAAWLAATGRTLQLWGPGRARPWSPERVGMATAATIVVVFGAHSLVDWTWFVPGNAMLALLCAGWVAGRGPVDEPVAPARRRSVEWRAGLAVAVAAVAVVAAWTAWQPERAANRSDDALAAAEARQFASARERAAQAHSIDPVAIDPLLTRAAIEQLGGHTDAARATLAQAVRNQPANPASWLALAQFEIDHGRRQPALDALGSALYLDPRSPSVQRAYLQAIRLPAGG